MNIFKKALPVVLAFMAFTARAQTADDIIAKNIEAMGGAAKIATLKTLKSTGTIATPNGDFAITFTKIHMKGSRMDLDVMGMSNYRIFTPDKAINFFPVQGMTEPKEMDADDVQAGQSQLDIQGLLNYKEKGKKAEYIGTEKADGADVYHLKITDKYNKPADYFIDTKTNRLNKVSGMAKAPDGSQMEAVTTFSDYKQNADGYWFAYSLTTLSGTITYDKIETNIPVDESIFKP